MSQGVGSASLGPAASKQLAEAGMNRGHAHVQWYATRGAARASIVRCQPAPIQKCRAILLGSAQRQAGQESIEEGGRTARPANSPRCIRRSTQAELFAHLEVRGGYGIGFGLGHGYSVEEKNEEIDADS